MTADPNADLIGYVIVDDPVAGKLTVLGTAPWNPAYVEVEYAFPGRGTTVTVRPAGLVRQQKLTPPGDLAQKG